MSPPNIQAPTAAAVPPPPNPPMFGANATKQKPQQKGSAQFNQSVLGTLPTATAQKSLIGQ